MKKLFAATSHALKFFEYYVLQHFKGLKFKEFYFLYQFKYQNKFVTNHKELHKVFKKFSRTV